MYFYTFVLACLVGVSLARPAEKLPVHETAKTIDESIMESLKSKGIHPSGVMVDQQTGNMIIGLDMVTTDDQFSMLHGTDDQSSNGRTKRKAYGGAIYRWTDKTIPYEFNHNDYQDFEVKEIKEAMNIFMKETCLKFRPATSADVNKIYFQQGYGGCSSQLGMVNGSQAVNLDRDGCRFMGLYFHEISHAIGMVHEHQLTDRGDVVTILWHNVYPNMKSAFFKYPAADIDRFGIPYDITSIMHYGINAFGKLGAQTIKPHDYSLESRVGRVFWKMMSFTDVKVINKMYKCDEKCGKVDCPGEGFVNKECQCVTPKGYYDSHCYNVQDEEKCLEWAVSGECQANAAWMGYNCRKACDECPKYKVPKKANADECHDKYYDEAQCKTWADKGYCDKYFSFMKRQCTKTCNACGKFGKCSNTNWRDADCDFWKGNGECESNPVWMKLQCADSCDSCGYRKPGECDNIDNDDQCEADALKGHCDDIRDIDRAVKMQTRCSKSCNSCHINKGQCDNDGNDKECLELAVSGECDANPAVVKRKCRKACDTCGFGIKGNCKNSQKDKQCEDWANTGECDANPKFMKYECARDCNSCEFLDPNACLNRHGVDKDCIKWESEGECQNNPGWMKDNCAKACGHCGNGEVPPTPSVTTAPKITTQATNTGGGGSGACTNDHESCESWAKGDGCEKGKGYMDIHCRKACSLCGPEETSTLTPPTNDKDNENSGACTNDHEDCESWARGDGCERGKEYMHLHCRKACSLCGKGGTTTPSNEKCRNDKEECEMWARTGQCEAGPEYMLSHCYKACKPEECGGSTGACEDERAECQSWKDGGHCEINTTVQSLCPKSCGVC